MKTIFALLVAMMSISISYVRAEEIKQPNVAGQFYPASKTELSTVVDACLNAADLSSAKSLEGKKIFALISPHAGYAFSGKCAAYGYKLIQGRKYSTVVVIGPSHHYGFYGASVYSTGAFRTPLGDIPIDEAFTRALIEGKLLSFEPKAFAQEHSVEVELPFLQTVLTGFKIVPIVIGECSFEDCRTIAQRLKTVIGARDDVLVVASTDLYHGYDYDEADAIDARTLSQVQTMDAQGLFEGFANHTMQMCGGLGVVTTLLLAKDLGHTTAVVLKHTNSCRETGQMEKGVWTVGYASVAIDSDGENGGIAMLTEAQKKRLLTIARQTIDTYLKTGTTPEITETDPVLTKNMGAFVTLHEHGQLRGCIGSMVGTQPLYLTIRDMAIESATGDPRFTPMQLSELKDVTIEISVLTPLERVASAQQIQLGTHGVLVRKGGHSGVFLPQVATETGWSKEEFLSQLCSQKAGLAADAWKDKTTELYVFTASVFSEN